ncbi:MAG: hypothetical protein V1809_08720 [Planctomycetota bacterium]
MAKNKWVPVPGFKGLTSAPKAGSVPSLSHADTARLAYACGRKTAVRTGRTSPTGSRRSRG